MVHMRWRVETKLGFKTSSHCKKPGFNEREECMKWIVLAGSSNTRKTWTLTEVVIALVKAYGAQLISPSQLPIPHPPRPPNIWPYYNDDTYELKFRGKLIIIKTDGDMPSTVNEGFKVGSGRNADILISATRARSQSWHIKTIDSKIRSKSAEVFVLAALDHAPATMSAIVAWRVQQIIDML